MISIRIEEEDWNLITASLALYAEEQNWHSNNSMWRTTGAPKAYDFGKEARRARTRLLELNLWKTM